MTRDEKLIVVCAVFVFTVAFMCCAVIISMVIDHYVKPREVKYDCAIAEITPDFTTAMREACRKLRSNS
jgi:hypothetical protein